MESKSNMAVPGMVLLSSSSFEIKWIQEEGTKDNKDEGLRTLMACPSDKR